MPDPTERLNAALEGRYSIERELGEGWVASLGAEDSQIIEDAWKPPPPDLVVHDDQMHRKAAERTAVLQGL